MTDLEIDQDGSQPDRPVPFPQLAETLKAKPRSRGASGLYDTAPTEPEPETPMPMTPAVPVPVLEDRSSKSRYFIIGGAAALGVLVVVVTSVLSGDGDAAPETVTPTPQIAVPTPPDVEKKVAPKPPQPPAKPKVDPRAALDEAMEDAGFTVADLQRLESTKAAAKAHAAAPDDPTAIAALTEAVRSAELTPGDAKKKVYYTTKALRDLDRAGITTPEAGDLWRELLSVRKALEGENPDLPALFRRLTAVETKALSLLPS